VFVTELVIEELLYLFQSLSDRKTENFKQKLQSTWAQSIRHYPMPPEHYRGVAPVVVLHDLTRITSNFCVVPSMIAKDKRARCYLSWSFGFRRFPKKKLPVHENGTEQRQRKPTR
jgi:hypothetical protein